MNVEGMVLLLNYREDGITRACSIISYDSNLKLDFVQHISQSGRMVWRKLSCSSFPFAPSCYALLVEINLLGSFVTGQRAAVNKSKEYTSSLIAFDYQGRRGINCILCCAIWRLHKPKCSS